MTLESGPGSAGLGWRTAAPMSSRKIHAGDGALLAGLGTAAACAADPALRPWPHNALRHSYASYRLGIYRRSGKQYGEMGQSSRLTPGQSMDSLQLWTCMDSLRLQWICSHPSSHFA
jgi:hypothetical protein